jgi:hypothetical protein
MSASQSVRVSVLQGTSIRNVMTATQHWLLTNTDTSLAFCDDSLWGQLLQLHAGMRLLRDGRRQRLSGL